MVTEKEPEGFQDEGQDRLKKDAKEMAKGKPMLSSSTAVMELSM